MKLIIFCYVFILTIVISGCMTEQEKAVQNATETANLYIEQTMNYDFDMKLRNKVYHNFINFLGFETKYSKIPEEIPRIKGDYICKEAKIEKILTDNVWVNGFSEKDNIEETVFIKINYSVIAKLENKKIKLLDEEIQMSQYIILANDDIDNLFKIIDYYPSIINRNIIGLPLIINNPEKYLLSETEIEVLQKYLK